MLRIVDPLNLQGKSNSVWMPAGGWRANWAEDLKIIGYQDPELEGAGVGAAQRRAGQAPLLGRRGGAEGSLLPVRQIELYVDKETFQGSWNRKFSWQGELLEHAAGDGATTSPHTRARRPMVDYIQGSNMSYQTRREHQRQIRATIAGLKSGSQSSPGRPRDVRARAVRHELAVPFREVSRQRRSMRRGAAAHSAALALAPPRR